MKYGIYVKSNLSGTAREIDLDHQSDHCHGIVEDRRGVVAVELREPGTGNGPTLPARSRLLELARTGAFEALVVDTWERLGRDAVEARKVIEQLRSLGVSVCATAAMPSVDHDTALAEITACCARIGAAADDLVGRLVAVGVAIPTATEIAQDLVTPGGVETARERLKRYVVVRADGASEGAP